VLTGSFEFMGAQALPLAGASHIVGTDDVKFPTTWDVMNATSNVAKLYVGGVPLSGTFAKTLSLDVDNSLRAQTAIGNLAPIGCGSGTLKVTGKLSAYFANSTLYDKFTGNTASSIALVVKDAAGNGYGYKVPAIEFTGATITSGSWTQDIMVDLDFSAKIDNGRHRQDDRDRPLRRRRVITRGLPVRSALLPRCPWPPATAGGHCLTVSSNGTTFEVSIQQQK
jgi:hypothetical protein